MQQQARKIQKRVRNDFKRKRIPAGELTLDWARSNVELTERKLNILKALYAKHLLRIDQLEYFLPNFGHQKQSQLLLRRDINKLHEVHFLDKATKKPMYLWNGDRKRTEVIAMGQIGTQFVGWKYHYKRIKYQDGGTILPRTAHHILRIHDMEIQTREFLKKMNVEVVAWEHECGNLIVKHPNELNPDAFFAMLDHTTGKSYTAFAEYDTGKDDFKCAKKFPNLTKKFERYREVKNWGAWYQKDLSTQSENKFPHLFFVTEDQKRFPVVPEIISSYGLDHTTCMQQDYVQELENFIHRMRAK
ncbi:hypothetical protein IC620_15970 [Hazenella sp. IB182357]|uniref:Replication-relaxation n=1 Tax=Polycladospora coralii TaxID=2771432 RepID=A0A926NCR0_9BACL|nr:hypothetical protein [Polycladospora coralii]MBD1373842.1 hypothetical protein [Polycladospora coralii]